MRSLNHALALSAGMLATASLALGCGYSKTTLPYQRTVHATPAPTAQRLLATAATRAVDEATKLEGVSLTGKRVCVGVSGVMPMSDRALLDYLRDAVMAGLAKHGALVSPYCDGAPAPLVGGKTPTPGPSEFDYRAIVTLHAGGIDIAHSRSVSTWKLVGQLASVVGGAALVAGASTEVDEHHNCYGYSCSSGSSTNGAAVAGVAVGSLALVGGAVWAIVSPPVEDTTRLTAATDITLVLVPARAGGKVTEVRAEGQEELEITPDHASEFVLDEESQQEDETLRLKLE